MKKTSFFQFARHFNKFIPFFCLPLFATLYSNSEDTFTYIYENGIWGTNDQGEPHSGGGSRLNTTVEYRQFLQQFMLDHEIKTVVDIGCGDWEFSQALNWNGIDYTGYEVVQALVAQNNERFGQENIHFLFGDITQTDLLPSDLLICKDVLQHLSNESIQIVIEKFKNYKYCLITNDVNPHTLTSHNPNIANGDSRLIDLTQPPFSVKAEKVLIFNSVNHVVKQVLLIDNTKD